MEDISHDDLQFIIDKYRAKRPLLRWFERASHILDDLLPSERIWTVEMAEALSAELEAVFEEGRAAGQDDITSSLRGV